MIITKYRSKVGNDYKVSKHFKLIEFASPKVGGGYEDKVIYDTNIVARLEKIRASFGGGGVIITSGYRSPTYNAKVGGASNSAHLYGQAVDFKVKDKAGLGVSSRRVCLYLESTGWKTSIGYIGTATHIDTKYANLMDETKNPYYFLSRHGVTFSDYFGYNKMTVKPLTVNVRNLPSLKGTIVGKKFKGQKVYAYKVVKDEAGGEWVKISYWYPRYIAKRLLV